MENEKIDQQEQPCCCRKSTRSPEDVQKLMNRLNRMEGQINGLKRMVQADAYCVDILTQSAAVRAAMTAFSRELLSMHMHTCVAEHVRHGDTAILDELDDTLARFMK